ATVSGMLSRLFGPPDIAKLRERRDVEGLARALSHIDPLTRSRAARALGHLRDAAAIDPLVSALKDADESVRVDAADALVSVGPAIVPPVVRRVMSVTALHRDEYRAVLKVLESILPQLDAAALTPLVECLRHPDGDMKRAASGLFEKRGSIGVPVLI